MRSLYVHCLSTTEDIRLQRCLKAITIPNTYQRGAKRDNSINTSSHSGRNLMTKELQTITILSKEAFSELSLLVWPLFMERLQLAQEDILPSA